MIGRIISHYEIIEKLGEGGMGVVYRAEDLRLRRHVAIKLFPSIVTASPDDRSRFFQEARLASALNHPNILTIFEFDEFEGNAFIVSECVDGTTLSALIQDGQIPIPRVLDIGLQIAAGIAEAHNRGIVHRDIKPDNVMVSSQGQVKVMDFGLARVMGSSHVTSPGSLIGTFAYMSPEQINEEEVDEQSDIFSFGTLLYQMTTGELPFRGKTVGELLSAVTRKNPEPIRRKRPGAPRELDRIIMKALQKGCDRRYATMRDMIVDLERLRANPYLRRRFELAFRLPRPVLAITLLVPTLLIAGYYLMNRVKSRTAVSPLKAIAVLPFHNANEDSASRFLGLGIADDIITRLTYIQSLRVRPTSSVTVYDGRVVAAAVAGAELNADYVVEGRYQRNGDRVYINAQLVDARAKSVLWGDMLDIRWSDIGTVEDNLAGRIVQAMKIQLTQSEQAGLRKVKTKNAEAYEQYARAVALAANSSANNNAAAVQLLERAVAADTSFADAYALLGDSYIERFWSNYSSDPAWIERGITMARRAIRLNPDLPLAYTVLSFGLRTQGDYIGGLRASCRALDIDPHNANALEDVGGLYQNIGDFLRAKVIFEGAAESDISLNIFRIRARLYMFQGRYREGIFELQRAIQGSPDDAWLRAGLLAVCYIRLGDLYKAEQEIQKAAAIEPGSPQIPLAKAALFTARGDYAAAQAAIDSLGDYPRRDYAMARQVASIYARQGRADTAFAWMDTATKLGNYWYSWYLSDPWFDGVRMKPRFQELTDNMKKTLDSVASDLHDRGL